MALRRYGEAAQSLRALVGVGSLASDEHAARGRRAGAGRADLARSLVRWLRSATTILTCRIADAPASEPIRLCRAEE
jgi:hypothetical protein